MNNYINMKSDKREIILKLNYLEHLKLCQTCDNGSKHDLEEPCISCLVAGTRSLFPQGEQEG